MAPTHGEEAHFLGNLNVEKMQMSLDIGDRRMSEVLIKTQTHKIIKQQQKLISYRQKRIILHTHNE